MPGCFHYNTTGGKSQAFPCCSDVYLSYEMYTYSCFPEHRKQTNRSKFLAQQPKSAFPGSTVPRRSSVFWLAPSGCLLLGLLLQPFSDFITNTFLWKVGELFLNPLTHSCNQSITQPRVRQGLWGNPPWFGFCSSLIGMARCCAVIIQRYINCSCHLANMNAELPFAWASSRAREEGCTLWRR